MTTRPRCRLQLSLSPAMRLSLEVLAARTGLPVSAQATMILRQALDRTIHSAEVQRRLGDHNARRNHAMWQEEVQVDHAIETEYARLAQEGGNSLRARDALLPKGMERDVKGPVYGIGVEETEAGQ